MDQTTPDEMLVTFWIPNESSFWCLCSDFTDAARAWWANRSQTRSWPRTGRALVGPPPPVPPNEFTGTYQRSCEGAPPLSKTRTSLGKWTAFAKVRWVLGGLRLCGTGKLLIYPGGDRSGAFPAWLQRSPSHASFFWCCQAMPSNEVLVEAVEQQDLDTVQILLYQFSAEDLDSNTPDSRGLTPLDIAIMTNNIPIAKLLLKAGAKESPHCESSMVLQPLWISYTRGHHFSNWTLYLLRNRINAIFPIVKPVLSVGQQTSDHINFKRV